MSYSFTRTAHAWHESPRPSGRSKWTSKEWREEVARGSYEAMQAVARLYGYEGPQWSPARDGETTDRFESKGLWYDIEEVHEYHPMPMTDEERATAQRRYWAEVEADMWRGFSAAERFTLESKWAGAIARAKDIEQDRRIDR